MACQLLVDLYGCDKAIIDDIEKIKEIAYGILKEINSQIVEECYHKFQPIGITYIAVITKSHFSIHTWPENSYAAVDIFSCDEDLPEIIAERLKALFKSDKMVARKFERDIGGRL